MRAGLLRNPVEIQAAQAGRDSYGQPLNTYGTVARVFAAIEPLTGEEPVIAQQQVSGVTHRVRIRWRDDIPVVGRVLHRGRQLEIKAVLDIHERRREAHLLCVELQAATPEPSP